MPEHANDAAGPADAAETSGETAAEAQKRRFREALDRKKGVNHPQDDVAGGKNLHGRGGATTRQEFRRKSG